MPQTIHVEHHFTGSYERLDHMACPKQFRREMDFMNTNNQHHRAILQDIAERAML